MSSTYAHYQGPASLPSDYAILSRYAAPDSVSEDESEDERPMRETGGSTPRIPRRTSFPSSYLRPRNPTMGPLPQNHPSSSLGSDTTETTPLLAPLVPRIEEEVDENDDSNETALKMFWEELRILTRYALPVFGSVSLLWFTSIAVC